jgi:hypothetical protein
VVKIGGDMNKLLGLILNGFDHLGVTVTGGSHSNASFKI